MQERSHEQSSHLERHYHEPVTPHSSTASTVLAVFLGLIVCFLLVVGAIKAFNQVAIAGVIVAFLTIVIAFFTILALLGGLIWHKWHTIRLNKRHAELDVEAKENQVDNETLIAEAEAAVRQAEAKRIEAEAEVMRITVKFDEQGNAALRNPHTWQVIQLSGQMREHPGLHSLSTNYRYDYKDGSTRVTEEGQPGQSLLAGGNLHIPTFAESLAAGDIGPGQRDMLFCYELLQDEMSRLVTGISPVRGEIGIQHTQFIVAGSQSGKTTYMSGMVAQAAFLKTLFYIVDPHKMHPEKSISAKVAAFKDFFILPPAATHDEIKRLLAHATRTRDDLIQQKPTPYQGYHIMVIVDEVPALMAWQRSPDKNLKQLYTALALFMQSIGTQTAKFGMTGLFSSQFATKEQLGDIDIRDACMSQFIMRLHPTQAQAMRILGPEVVRDIPKLEKGHGYLMLSDSTEARRVAAGNVTMSDLTQAAHLLAPSPVAKTGKTVERNQLERRSIIPIRDGVEAADSASETGEKASRNQVRNQIEPALAAKLEQVRQLIASGMVNKGDLLVAVWGVRPGSSDKYKQAEAEYKQIMTCLAERGA